MQVEEMLNGEQAIVIKSILYVYCIMYILAFKEYEYINNRQPYKEEEEEQVTEEQTEAVRKEEQFEEEKKGCKMKRG